MPSPAHLINDEIYYPNKYITLVYISYSWIYHPTGSVIPLGMSLPLHFINYRASYSTSYIIPHQVCHYLCISSYTKNVILSSMSSPIDHIITCEFHHLSSMVSHWTCHHMCILSPTGHVITYTSYYLPSMSSHQVCHLTLYISSTTKHIILLGM